MKMKRKRNEKMHFNDGLSDNGLCKLTWFLKIAADSVVKEKIGEKYKTEAKGYISVDD